MPASPPFSCTSSGDFIADRRYAYADAALSEGDAIAARDLFEQTLEQTPDWPPARFGLAKACLVLGETDAAKAAFHAVLAADPDDHLGAGVYLAQISPEAGLTSAMSDAYIAALFDDYADRFDHHLVQSLQYRAPQLLIEALDSVRRKAHFSEVIDLGCGTGLMARALLGRTDTLSGVDLSADMIRQARASNLYSALETEELGAFLAKITQNSADLIIAADVFCYVPDLSGIFLETRRILRPEGLLAFTIQTHPGQGAIIGADARVHHAVSHIEALAGQSGFAIRLGHAASSRMDRGQPVPGAVFVLAPAEELAPA